MMEDKMNNIQNKNNTTKNKLEEKETMATIHMNIESELDQKLNDLIGLSCFHKWKKIMKKLLKIFLQNF